MRKKVKEYYITYLQELIESTTEEDVMDFAMDYDIELTAEEIDELLNTQFTVTEEDY